MCIELLQRKGLYDLLLQIDAALGEQARQEGCCCGGRLDRANYKRKPRCIFKKECGEEIRHSLCCCVEGCRRRVTPPSVRFLGRRVYVGVVVVLACALAQGLTPVRVRKLREVLGVGRQTLRRWRVWWSEAFAASAQWKEIRASLSTPVEAGQLPRSLWERFGGGAQGAVQVLMALAGATSGAGVH